MIDVLLQFVEGLYMLQVIHLASKKSYQSTGHHSGTLLGRKQP